MASIFGIFILELLAFRWGTARLAQIGMTHGQHFLAVIYRGTLLTEIPDAHGHDVGGSVAAHGPEGANTEMGSLEKQPLDEVEKVARELQLEIKTQPGDMHFINNFTVLHRREGFVDGPESQQRRHLVRMRLRSSELGWSVPEELQEDWDSAFSGDAATEQWNLEPMPSEKFPLRKYTN